MTAEIRGTLAYLIKREGVDTELEAIPSSFLVEAYEGKLILRQTEGDVNEKASIYSGLRAVIHGGIVISTKNSEKVTLRDGEQAVEILPDGTVRTFVGTLNGFEVRGGENRLLKKEYTAGKKIITPRGTEIKAIRGDL
ncbi:hypothetical protein KKD37_04605 [Patescibacteria group bacterium]|nr:hypothetical protein [Patescibacteria group bacterium]